MKTGYLKVVGYSIGDPSVGMFSREFSVDLGLQSDDVDLEDREMIEENIIRCIWELHDNGVLKWNFSDEPEAWRVMDYEKSKNILTSLMGR